MKRFPYLASISGAVYPCELMVTFVVEHLEEEFYDWCQYGKP